MVYGRQHRVQSSSACMEVHACKHCRRTVSMHTTKSSTISRVSLCCYVLLYYSVHHGPHRHGLALVTRTSSGAHTLLVNNSVCHTPHYACILWCSLCPHEHEGREPPSVSCMFSYMASCTYTRCAMQCADRVTGRVMERPVACRAMPNRDVFHCLVPE